MLHTVTFRTLALAACGWLLACEASALTLGRSRGAVLIGRPLEVTIPVSDVADRADPCADAELFYGDTRVSRAPSVRWEPGPNRDGVLRITSAVPIDEPVVTIALRLGCGQSVSRRYTLLAEPPPANEASTMPGASRPAVGPRSDAVEAARAAAPPARDAVAAAAPAAPARGGAAPAAAPRGAAAPVPARPAPERAARPPRAPAAETARRPPESRLRLDPADLLAQRDPTLRLSSTLGRVDEGARSAAAALWRALQRTPEEILAEGQRLDALDRELQALRSQTQQNATAVSQMRSLVETARKERNQVSFLSAVLLALLAALAAWLVYRWRRSAKMADAGHWFEPAGEPSAVPPLTPAPSAAAAAAGLAAAVAATKARGDQAAAPGLNETQPLYRPQTAAWAPDSGTMEFQASQGGTVRMVGVQEVLDVQDKVDFFLSIGQPDQAVAMLEAHIHDQVETSALPWMDLLELYHSLGRRDDYERLRAEFIQRYSAQVPDFDHFGQPTSSLENYGRALSRIVALWPSRRVLSVIEESIFRKPGLPGAEPFSLEAYRELVLLYHIARDVAPPEDSITGDRRITDFTATSLQPLNMTDIPEATLAAGALSVDLPVEDEDRDLLLIPPSSPRIGVDIDLGDIDVAPTPAAPSLRAELPPLDFDTSIYDEMDDRKP